MKSGDPLINNDTMPNNYISHTPERDASIIEIRTVTIDMASFPNLELTKKWSIQRPYFIEYVNVPLPLDILYMDPHIPMVEYIAMLIEKGHRFRLMDGQN